MGLIDFEFLKGRERLIKSSVKIKEYIVMHKNIPVMDVELDTVSGAVASVGAVHHEEHVPVGIPVKKACVDRNALNEWWQDRAIPETRAGIKEALKKLPFSDTKNLPEKCLGLSLSDQYWLCPKDTPVQWSDINFFDHSFSDDMGNILFGKISFQKEHCEETADEQVTNTHINLMSPDNTTDGWLKKRWVIMGGKRFLIKGGSGRTRQEPYNEVLASCIMDRLKIPHVAYTLTEYNGCPCSLCEDFISQDTEFITAWRIMKIKKKPNHVSVYQHYLNCCGELGISGVRESLDRMFVLDYLIVNEDRHLNNFGAIRNAENLKYIGAAPIFDSGTALWFDKPQPMIYAGAKAVCKPFKNSHEEQIKLVTDFSWLDFSALNQVDEELREIARNSTFIDDARSSALCRALNQRIRMLKEVACRQKQQVFLDSTQFDVEQNIAYSGHGGNSQ